MDTASAKETNDFKLRSPLPEEAQRLGEICYEAFKTISESHGFPADFPSVEAAVGLMTMMTSVPFAYGVVAEDGERATTQRGRGHEADDRDERGAPATRRCWLDRGVVQWPDARRGCARWLARLPDRRVQRRGWWRNDTWRRWRRCAGRVLRGSPSRRLVRRGRRR